MSENEQFDYKFSCIGNKEHDFSNEFSKYCSNGCGEKESFYTIKYLYNEKRELKKKCDELETELNRYKISNETDSKSLRYTVKENLALRLKVIELEQQNAKLVEALRDWILWENKQIEKEGEYCGKEINRLISQGRQVLAELGIK